MKQKGFMDSLIESSVDALSFGNVVKRVLSFLFFGFVLSLRTLISNVDAVGKSVNSQWYHYFFAFNASVWEGVKISLASAWDIVTNFGYYISTGSWGSVVIGLVLVFALIGLFFQPVSLIINIFDNVGSSDAGNKSGQGTSFLARLSVTLLILLILSPMAFYGGVDDPLLSNTPSSETINNGTIGNATEMSNTSVNQFVDGNLIDLTGGIP